MSSLAARSRRSTGSSTAAATPTTSSASRRGTPRARRLRLGRHLLPRGRRARCSARRPATPDEARRGRRSRRVAGRPGRGARGRRRARGRPHVPRARRPSRLRPLPRRLGHRRRALGTLNAVSRAPGRVLERPGAAALCALSPSRSTRDRVRCRSLVQGFARAVTIPRSRERLGSTSGLAARIPLRGTPPRGRVTLDRGTTSGVTR